MRIGVNTAIALTYLISRPKQSLVAALGVTFGISMYIFMNSLIAGSNEWSEKIMLSSTPHLRLYSGQQMNSTAITDRHTDNDTVYLISNPQYVDTRNQISNPDAVAALLRGRKEITSLSKQVSTTVIFSAGNVQQNGTVSGVNIFEQDKMFDITSTMIAGSVQRLAENPEGIIIGTGLAERLNVRTGGYIQLTTANGVSKRVYIAGVFKTTVKGIDNTRAYTNISTVQQLLRKERDYITDIYINLSDYNQTEKTAKSIEADTGYTVETWQSNNEQSLAGKKIRDVIANSVVLTILIVAGFGIYNILNMVIYEKLKEIAILKATGFKGKHVVGIFIRQALLIGVVGAIGGLAAGWLISYLISKTYLGLGNVTYLPITFYPQHYIQGILFGVCTAFFAGYIPAIRAAGVDPVKIIRG